VREHRLVTDWAEIVGERVAVRAWPVGLKAGVLRVRVSNSAWLHELSFLKDALVGRANQIVGNPPLVKEIRFTQGTPKPGDTDEDDVVAALARRRGPKRVAPARPAPSAAASQRIERETEAITDPELRAAVRSLRMKIGA
jgi:predicted nucleic acid-binding Zn ribbon protein